MSFFEKGKFKIGCNYWASHAAIFMWREWRPDIIEKDFEQLSADGIKLLRVFPLWPDFQPLKALYTISGRFREYRIEDERISDTPAGRAGVSEEMMKRFEFLANTAEKYNIKLIVALVTGWMSGRLFVPEAFVNLNHLTDPKVIIWEIKFVKYFVRYFCGHPAICAWEPGNECNCMAPVSTREEAWLWTETIANAIRSEDSTRPVISGMHGLGVDEMNSNKKWLISDQGETCDILTTHPYPLFTPHCKQDAMNEIRSCLHAAAESCLYADIGGEPCIVEEIGTLSRMLCSDEISADYIRCVLFSSWAYDLRALLWWCAYDQNHIEKPPYEWHTFEGFLGLYDKKRQPKPVAREFNKFSCFLEKAPSLPSRIRDAVCILSEGQDQWAAAYSSFILSVQAGFDIEFQYMNQPLKESSLYLLPSLESTHAVHGKIWKELIKRVKEGATLYISCGEGILAPFSEYIGAEIKVRKFRSENYIEFNMSGINFKIQSPIEFIFNLGGAEILAVEKNGNPVFLKNTYGKGEIYFLCFSLETTIAKMAGIFEDTSDQNQWFRIYELFSERTRNKNRIIQTDIPYVGITEHPLSETERYAVMINYSPKPVKLVPHLRDGWKIEKILYGKEYNHGDDNTMEIEKNDAVILLLNTV